MRNFNLGKAVVLACVLCFICSNSIMYAQAYQVDQPSEFGLNDNNTPKDNNKKGQDNYDRVVRASGAMNENNTAFNDLNKSLDILLGRDRSEKTEVNFFNNLNKQFEKQHAIKEKQHAINTFKTCFPKVILGGQQLPEGTFGILKEAATSDNEFAVEMQKKFQEIVDMAAEHNKYVSQLNDPKTENKPYSEQQKLAEKLKGIRITDVKEALSVLNEVCNGVCNTK